MLSQEKQQEIIAGTHTVQSKAQMHEYVNPILAEDWAEEPYAVVAAGCEISRPTRPPVPGSGEGMIG